MTTYLNPRQVGPTRELVREIDGTFTARAVEWLGCIATGQTEDQAMTALERTMEAWERSCIERGMEYPHPTEGDSRKTVSPPFARVP